MTDYSLSLQEQETIINYNREDDKADVYTHDPKLISKLDKLCKKYPDKCFIQTEDNNWKSKTYSIPKSFISIRSTREYSEETLEKFRENGRKQLQRLHATT